MLNGSIISVTGRPRKADNQGSIENIIKLIKRVTADLEESEQQEGRKTNWTVLQVNVMSLVNKQSGKGKNSILAHESVYEWFLTLFSNAKKRICKNVTSLKNAYEWLLAHAWIIFPAK